MRDPADEVRRQAFKEASDALLFYYPLSDVPTVFVFPFGLARDVLGLLSPRPDCGQRVGHDSGHQLRESSTDKILLSQKGACDELVIKQLGTLIDVHLDGPSEREQQIHTQPKIEAPKPMMPPNLNRLRPDIAYFADIGIRV